jgi:hypothetical protein
MIQVAKLLGIAILMIVCGASWLIYQAMPPADFLITFGGVIGLGDLGYMWKTSQENPIKIEAGAALDGEKAKLQAEVDRLKAELEQPRDI